MRYYPVYWGEGNISWGTYGPPEIDFPPFDDDFAFRVVGTGSCLYLREAPDGQSGVVDCLSDGSRVLAGPGLHQFEGREIGPIWTVASDDYSTFTSWIYVRAGSGAEGWVSREYLEWW